MKSILWIIPVLLCTLILGACKKEELKPESPKTIEEQLLGKWEVYAYYNEHSGKFIEHGYGSNYLFISVYAAGIEFHSNGTYRYLPDYLGDEFVHAWELDAADGMIRFFHDPYEYDYYILRLDEEELWISVNEDGFSRLGYKLTRKDE